MQSSQSTLENYIKTNYSLAQQNLLANTNILDKKIFDNITSLNNSIIASQSTIEQYIIQNATTLDWRIFYNISALNYSLIDVNVQVQNITKFINEFVLSVTCVRKYGYEMVNGSCIQTSCAIKGQQVINGICQCANFNSVVVNDSCICPKYSFLVGSICTCPENSIMTYDICICTIEGQYMQGGVCACPIQQFVVNNMCQLLYEINVLPTTCSQYTYMTAFDVTAVTHQIVSQNNFSNGYVFNSSVMIQNAFIDVFDNVYTTVTPLFQSQNQFKNIKIQIGLQTVSSGAILTTLTAIQILKVNIISKDQTHIIANSNLSIMNSMSSCQITKLLLNLSISQSTGNINLIKAINGVLNISDYQILGCYQSTGTVSMVAYKIGQSNIFINLLSFMPQIYIVGNYSSLMLCIVNQSTLNINNISIIQGNNISYSLSNEITTNSSICYQFGGVVTTMNISELSINELIYDSYQVYKTDYIQSSGILVGYSSYKTTNISILKLCFQQLIDSTTLKFNQFGLLGYIQGHSSIQQSMITLSIQGIDLNQVGLIGLQYIYSALDMINIKVSVNMITNSSSQGNIGALIGQLNSESGYIENVFVVSCNLSSKMNVGGLIGYSQNILILNSTLNSGIVFGSSQSIAGFIGYSTKNTTISNSILNNSMISATTYYIGGFVGYHLSLNLLIQNSTVSESTIISSTSTSAYSVGGFVGQSSANTTIYNSTSKQNTIQGYQTIGGYIGSLTVGSNLTIDNSTANLLNMKADFNVGGFIGKFSDISVLIRNSSVYQVNLSSQQNLGGFIGMQQSSTLYKAILLIINSTVSYNNISGTSQYSSGFIGRLDSSNATIIDSIVSQCNISGTNVIGGIIGYSYISKLIMQSIVVQNVLLSGPNVINVGGIVGFTYKSDIALSSSSIQQIQIKGNSGLGIVLGIQSDVNTFAITSSFSSQNFVNGAQVNNCPILTDAFLANGC
ncbi:Conserved_hypothetical protein [Hexamita inflata]|uniref:Uncharacterized protein n=1 Tax=Hexamita inflata TaxID=28002 RepID=A0AA86R5X5_9EUKA|nr:Conserved hypothetical protein [Hexamita inflata]